MCDLAHFSYDRDNCQGNKIFLIIFFIVIYNKFIDLYYFARSKQVSIIFKLSIGVAMELSK